MAKNQAVLIAAVFGIVGLIVGMFGTSWFWLKSNATFAKSAAVARAETGIMTKVALLEHLRSAHYAAAVVELEALLDTDLAGAGALARGGAEFSSNAVKAVEAERKARGVSGYEPSNEAVNTAVHDAFLLVPQSPAGMGNTETGWNDEH